MREFGTFPHRKVFVGLADEEHLALVRFGGIGAEHQHALLLLDAGEVKQIGRRVDSQRAVAGGWELVGRMHDGHAAWGQQGRELLAVGNKQSGINRRVAHENLFPGGCCSRSPSRRQMGAKQGGPEPPLYTLF